MANYAKRNYASAIRYLTLGILLIRNFMRTAQVFSPLVQY
jgi:hypothetical protein